MKKVLFILGQLNDADIEWLSAHGTKERIPNGSAVIREGEPIEALYIVLDGSLAVTYRARPNQIVAPVGVGEILGEMSFVDASPPSATVTATTGAVVLSIPRSVLADRLEEQPAFAARFYRAIAMLLSDRLRRVVTPEPRGPLDVHATGTLEADELDPNVLESVWLAGERFERMLRRLAGD